MVKKDLGVRGDIFVAVLNCSRQEAEKPLPISKYSMFNDKYYRLLFSLSGLFRLVLMSKVITSHWFQALKPLQLPLFSSITDEEFR